MPAASTTTSSPSNAATAPSTTRLAAGRHDAPAVHELVGAVSRDRAISEVWEGSATLELLDAPGEEHAALAPERVGRGFRFTFAYTVDDLETLRDLTAEP